MSAIPIGLAPAPLFQTRTELLPEPDRAWAGDRLPVCLPASLRRRGTQVLHQQFWLWGQDIRRTDGNLLLARGFAKERPPVGEQGSRAYTLSLDGDRAVVLWGFGLFYGDAALGGLYLSRFRLVPLLVAGAEPPAGVWLPSHLPPRREPAGAAEWAPAGRLFVAALAWLGAYERWASRTVGAADRAATLAAWPHAACPAAELASFWFRVAERADASLRRRGPRGRPGRRRRRIVVAIVNRT